MPTDEPMQVDTTTISEVEAMREADFLKVNRGVESDGQAKRY